MTAPRHTKLGHFRNRVTDTDLCTSRPNNGPISSCQHNPSQPSRAISTHKTPATDGSQQLRWGFACDKHYHDDDDDESLWPRRGLPSLSLMCALFSCIHCAVSEGVTELWCPFGVYQGVSLPLRSSLLRGVLGVVVLALYRIAFNSLACEISWADRHTARQNKV